MDRVRFLTKHLKSVIHLKEVDGHYGDDGVWVDGEIVKTSIEGVYMPFSSKDFKEYPQGFIEIGDLDFKTQAKLSLGDSIEVEGKIHKVMNEIDYLYLANLKCYVLRRVGND